MEGREGHLRSWRVDLTAPCQCRGEELRGREPVVLDNRDDSSRLSLSSGGCREQKPGIQIVSAALHHRCGRRWAFPVTAGHKWWLACEEGPSQDLSPPEVLRLGLSKRPGLPAFCKPRVRASARREHPPGDKWRLGHRWWTSSRFCPNPWMSKLSGLLPKPPRNYASLSCYH